MKHRTALMRQKMALGAGLVLVAAVLVYLTTIVIKDAPLGEYVEGEHYQLIENPRRINGEKVEVAEVFSYACIHCYTLEPDLADWAKENEQTVDFKHVPAISSNLWRTLARGYYSMKQLGILEDHHLQVFRAIHDRGANLSTDERFADFMAERGVDKKEFLKVWSSLEVDREMKNADSLQRRFKVSSTPTLVVNGKYLVKTTQAVGRSRILGVVEHLVDKEIAEKKALPKS